SGGSELGSWGKTRNHIGGPYTYLVERIVSQFFTARIRENTDFCNCFVSFFLSRQYAFRTRSRLVAIGHRPTGASLLKCYFAYGICDSLPRTSLRPKTRHPGLGGHSALRQGHPGIPGAVLRLQPLQPRPLDFGKTRIDGHRPGERLHPGLRLFPQLAPGRNLPSGPAALDLRLLPALSCAWNHPRSRTPRIHRL